MTAVASRYPARSSARPQLARGPRLKAAREGKALPGGGYPIRNPRELMAARRLAGKSKRYSKAVIQAHIRRRARALGVKLSADQTAAIDLAIDAGLLTIDLTGHWRHNWVPLDAAAVMSKNHGHRSKGSKYEQAAVGKLGLGQHHDKATPDTAAVIRRAAILHVAGRHKAAQQHLEDAKRAGHPDAERLTRIQKKLRLHAAGYRAAAMSLSADGADWLDLAGKWRHGWIPLDAAAALSKAKGNHARAARYVKPPRKTAAHIAEYRQLRQAQDRRFESHHGAGASVADTRTPEYQAYFGTGEHAGSTHRVEQRVTFRGHLANLSAQKQDSKERAHSFRLGHQLGRQHARSKESSAVQDKQYETVSQRAAHEGHFAEGYSAGLTHQPTPRAKPAPVAAGKGRAGTSVTSAIQVGKGGRSKSDRPTPKRSLADIRQQARSHPDRSKRQEAVKEYASRLSDAQLRDKLARHPGNTYIKDELARRSSPPKVDKLATKRDTGGMTKIPAGSTLTSGIEHSPRTHAQSGVSDAVTKHFPIGTRVQRHSVTGRKLHQGEITGHLGGELVSMKQDNGKHVGIHRNLLTPVREPKPGAERKITVETGFVDRKGTNFDPARFQNYGMKAQPLAASRRRQLERNRLTAAAKAPTFRRSTPAKADRTHPVGSPVMAKPAAGSKLAGQDIRGHITGHTSTGDVHVQHASQHGGGIYTYKREQVRVMTGHEAASHDFQHGGPTARPGKAPSKGLDWSKMTPEQKAQARVSGHANAYHPAGAALPSTPSAAPESHISAKEAFRMSKADLEAKAAKGDPVATAELRRRADKRAGKKVPARVAEPAGRPKADAPTTAPALERRRQLTRSAASSTPPVVRRSKPPAHTAEEVQSARMTYRERRERRAERLRGWSDKRQTAAAQVFKAGEPYRSDNAFNTQPGHIPFRAKLIAREDRAHESVQKAQRMAERARSIEAQAAGAIYSDDPHAIPALQDRIAKLEKQREQIKARNAAYRKEHKAELAKLTPYGRDRAMPHPSYELTNLGGNISRQRKRLEQLQRQAARK